MEARELRTELLWLIGVVVGVVLMWNLFTAGWQ